MSTRTDGLRALFAATIRPEDVTVPEVYRLWSIIEERLSHPDTGISGRLEMRLQPLNDMKMKALRRHGWPSKGFEIKVNGPYFTGRQGIGFESDGWIGFCGWASGLNSVPFEDGFEEWVRTWARHQIRQGEYGK